MASVVTFSNNVNDVLADAIHTLRPSKVLVLVDSNTSRCVLPLLPILESAHVITIPAGEQHKSIDTLTHVWKQMQQADATRHALMVNLGGGTVTDLGGLAAATYKRGIPFINVPTTLLAAIDAAVGGKTGINFNGLKNEIGVFCDAVQVIISSCFFGTLQREELMSGYAEMLKHAMLTSHDELDRLLGQQIDDMDWDDFLSHVETSVNVKRDIVAKDPLENGWRRVLNLGHTVGHALESLALQRGTPVTHGHAVACGLVTEAVLSHMALQFPSPDLHHLATFVRNRYGAIHITCNDYPTLLQFMHHDKKSRDGEINCTLLRQCGEPVIDNNISEADMQTALDIYRDLMGI